MTSKEKRPWQFQKQLWKQLDHFFIRSFIQLFLLKIRSLMSAFFTHSGALSCFSVEGKSWAFLWKHSCAMSLTSQGCTGHPWAHPQALVHLQLKPSVKMNSCRNCTAFCSILSFLVAHILLLTCSLSPHSWWEASGKSHWIRQIILIKKTWTRIFRSAAVWASFTLFRIFLPFSFPTGELSLYFHF